MVDLGIPGLGDAEFVGRGGFGQVYRAEQDGLSRAVAVKVIRVQEVSEAELRLFERECAAVGSLDWCPEIVSVFSTGTTPDGDPYLVMEYAPGGSLRDQLREHGMLPEHQVRTVAARMARALAAAHGAGLLHRDVKPANILLSRSGEVLLADFGIARALERSGHTSTAAMAGTVAYMAPELLQDVPASPASDVFSLGATLLEALTGRTPFGTGANDTAATMMRRALQAEEVDLSDVRVDPGFAAILAKCLAMRPEDRYADGQQLADDLAAGTVTSDAVAERTVARPMVPRPPVPLPPVPAPPGVVDSTVFRPRPPSPSAAQVARDDQAGDTSPIGAPPPTHGMSAAFVVGMVALALVLFGGVATATVLISRSGSDDAPTASSTTDPAAAPPSSAADDAPADGSGQTPPPAEVGRNRCWDGSLVERGSECGRAFDVRTVYWAFDFEPEDYGCLQKGDEGRKVSYADENCVFPGGSDTVHLAIYTNVAERDDRLRDYGSCQVVTASKNTMLCSEGSAGRVAIRYASDTHLMYASTLADNSGALDFLLDRMRPLSELRYGIPVG